MSNEAFDDWLANQLTKASIGERGTGKKRKSIMDGTRTSAGSIDIFTVVVHRSIRSYDVASWASIESLVSTKLWL